MRFFSRKLFFLSVGIVAASQLLAPSWESEVSDEFQLDMASSDEESCWQEARGSSQETALVAHRGDEQRMLENSPSALVNGALSGADYVEFDVRRAADGVLFIHHDEWTGRVTRCESGQKATVKTPWSELSSDCYYLNPDGQRGESLQTLKEVLQQLRLHPAGLVIDVKPDVGSEDMEHLAETLMSLVPAEGCPVGGSDRSTFDCFKRVVIYVNNYEAQEKLWQMTRQSPASRYAVLGNMTFLKIFADLSRAFAAPETFLNHDGVAVQFHKLKCEDYQRLRADYPNQKIFVWTLSQAEEYRRAKQIGVDGVITSMIHDFVSLRGQGIAP